MKLKTALTCLAIACSGMTMADYKAIIYTVSDGRQIIIIGDPSNPDTGDGSETTPPTSSGWLAFLQEHGNINSYTSLTEVIPNDFFSLAARQYTNDDLPSGVIGVPEWRAVILYSNNLNNLDFLEGATINQRLDLSNNNISSLSPLTQTDYEYLYLDGNNISDLSFLSHLENVYRLNLSNNPFTSIKPLENISSAQYLDIGKPITELDEYVNKFPVESSFCQKIGSRDISLYNGRSKLSSIMLCDIKDEWINFLNANNANTLTALDISEYEAKSISLYSKGLNDADMPLYPLDLSTMSGFDLRGNNLTHVDFLTNLTKVNNLNLSNNPLADISGISNITEFQYLYLPSEGTFDSLETFYNTSKGLIYLNRGYDQFKEINERLPYDSTICSSLATGSLSINQTNSSYNKMAICTTNDPFMDFVHDYNQVLPKASQEEIDSTDSILLQSKSLTNSNIPSNENWKFTDIGTLNLSSNDFTNVDFLSNLKTIKTLNLASNPLENINGLSGITEYNYFYLPANGTFDSLKPLENVSKGNIYLNRSYDAFKEINDRFLYTSPLCQALANGSLSFIQSNSNYNKMAICTTNDQLMDFLHDNDQLLKKSDKTEILATDTIEISNKGLTNAEVPPLSEWTIPELYSLSFYGNKLSNVDFLGNLKKVRTLTLRNNPLENIDGISGITEYTYLHLPSEGLFTSLKPLENLTKGQVYLNKSYDAFDEFNSSKFDYNTPICQNLASGNVTMVQSGTTYGKMSICTSNDVLMDFLHNYDQVLEKTKTSELTSTDSIKIDSKNLTNTDIPDKSYWTMNQLGELSLSYNNLTSVDFLGNITKINGNFSLRRNSLTNLSGLENLTEVTGNLSLDTMTTLTDLTALSNLRKAGQLDLTYNSLDSLAGLENLQGLSNYNSGLRFTGATNTFKDLSPLKNFTLGTIYLPNAQSYYDQNTVGFDWHTSLICDAIANGKVIFRSSSTFVGNGIGLCDTGDSVMNFLHKKGQLYTYKSQSEILPTDGISLSSVTKAEMPPASDWTITELRLFRLQNSDIDNLDFLSTLERMTTSNLTVSNNQLSDISGLAGFEGFSSKSYYVDLRGTNNTFTDISSLSSMIKGSVYLQGDWSYYDQSSTKFAASSSICQAAQIGDVRIFTNAQTSTGYIVPYENMCQ